MLRHSVDAQLPAFANWVRTNSKSEKKTMLAVIRSVVTMLAFRSKLPTDLPNVNEMINAYMIHSSYVFRCR